MKKGVLENLLFENGCHHELYHSFQGFLSSQGLSDEVMFGIVMTVVNEFMPKRLSPNVTLENLLAVKDDSAAVFYDDVLHGLTSEIRCCRLFLAGDRNHVLSHLTDGRMSIAIARILRRLIELRFYDHSMHFDGLSVVAYHIFDDMWEIIRPIAVRLDELAAAAKVAKPV